MSAHHDGSPRFTITLSVKDAHLLGHGLTELIEKKFPRLAAHYTKNESDTDLLQMKQMQSKAELLKDRIESKALEL